MKYTVPVFSSKPNTSLSESDFCKKRQRSLSYFQIGKFIVLFYHIHSKKKITERKKMTKEKIKTIDGASLLKMELPPITFTVESFLPQDFHILAGTPKVGKSWLLLSLCLRVAKGENFWKMPTKQGSVLYLCLEDSVNRIQQRLLDLTEDAPDNLHFATHSESLSGGVTEQIEMFIAEHSDIVLIVIDTLQKIRDGSGEGNVYAADYKDIGMLKEIADKYSVTILAVQHLRKQPSSDQHLMVSGSTGLIGAADGSYILKKDDPLDTKAKLYIRGRDIEEKIFYLEFSKDSCEWELISSDTPEDENFKNDNVINMLIEFMNKEISFQGTASELAEKIGAGIKPNVISRKLKRYEKELEEMGIEFLKFRTGEKREILLTYTPKNSNDDMTIKNLE